jgi:pimeloyl-ACP methyl ester carboxylesterase
VRRAVRRGYAEVTHGQMHYAECGEPASSAATPIVLLHQTPRSWREYAAVLPLVGARRRAIAVDTAGFGASDPVAGSASIEAWAAATLQLLDALALARAHVVGHHTGGVIAVELAARARSGRLADALVDAVHGRVVPPRQRRAAADRRRRAER